MKEYFVVTAVGMDRPGLVSRIAHEISRKGGNIERQRSQLMAGDFALMMLISADSEDRVAQSGMEGLSELSGDDLSVLVRRAPVFQEPPPDHGYGELLADGVDHLGIIDSITGYLLPENINIAHMDYDVRSVPFTGTTYFRMRAILIVPGSVDIADLRKHLAEMERNLEVDVLFRFPIAPDETGRTELP